MQLARVKGFILGFVSAVALAGGVLYAWNAVWHGTDWITTGGVIDAQKIAENLEYLKNEVDALKQGVGSSQSCTSQPLLDPTGLLPDVLDCNGTLAFLEIYKNHFGTGGSDYGCYYQDGTQGGAEGWFCISRSQQKIATGNWLASNTYNCPVGKTLYQLKSDGQIMNLKTVCFNATSTAQNTYQDCNAQQVQGYATYEQCRGGPTSSQLGSYSCPNAKHAEIVACSFDWAWGATGQFQCVNGSFNQISNAFVPAQGYCNEGP